MTPAKKTNSTFVRTIEVRIPGREPSIAHEMPLRVEHRSGMGGPNLTALVFYAIDVEHVVTILLSDDDKRDLINMLRRK